MIHVLCSAVAGEKIHQRNLAVSEQCNKHSPPTSSMVIIIQQDRDVSAHLIAPQGKTTRMSFQSTKIVHKVQPSIGTFESILKLQCVYPTLSSILEEHVTNFRISISKLTSLEPVLTLPISSDINSYIIYYLHIGITNKIKFYGPTSMRKRGST